MKPIKILLAEDDLDDQKLFFDFLEDRDDIKLLPAVENGEEVLMALENIPAEQLPDLIILDQNMPRRNGLQTIRKLKADERHKHIPMVIYSTYADQQLIKDASESGVTKVLSKPITKEGYLRMMDDLIQTFFDR